MGASVIIAAAGSAKRMNGTDKLMMNICGKPVLWYSLTAFSKAACTDKIVVVTSNGNFEHVKSLISEWNLNTETQVIVGKNTRQGSVLSALPFCMESSQVVMIHDAARPMILTEQIEKLYEYVSTVAPAAALGVPVKDTIKRIGEDGKILETPERSSLYIAQTPQAFEMNLYKRAAVEAQSSGAEYTDDCQLIEAFGEPVYMVDGDYRNIKITTPDDIITAENFLREKLL